MNISQNVARNLEQSLIQERKILTDSISNFIYLRLIGYVLTLLLVLISIYNRLTVSYSIIPLLCFEFFSLIILCINHQRPKEETVYLFMFENFMYGIFLISILVIIECRFDIVYVLILPSFHVLVNLMSIKFQTNKLGFPIFFIFNLVFYICTLFIVMKVVSLMDIDFYICFWPFYLSSFILLIMIMKNFFDFFDKKYYVNTTFSQVLFRLFITIIGSSFIVCHVLSIIYLSGMIF